MTYAWSLDQFVKVKFMIYVYNKLGFGMQELRSKQYVVGPSNNIIKKIVRQVWRG